MLEMACALQNTSSSGTKGYPTKRHYELLRKYGPCPIHRKTFLKKL